MSLRLWIWWLWLRVRLVVARWLGRDGEGRGRGGAPIDADPLGALKGELLSAAERLEEDERLGIPQVGVDYEPVEMTPALEARRDEVLGELRDYQSRRGARRAHIRRAYRRRHVAAFGAATALMVVAVAGASALTGIGTGLPEIDRLLGNLQEDSSETSSPSAADVRLDPSAAGVPMELHIDDTHVVTALTYVSRSKQLCTLHAAKPHQERKSGAPKGGGCVPPAFLEHRLDRDKALVSGFFTTDSGVALTGFASDDVQSVTIRGLGKSLKVEISDSWTTHIPGLDAIRVFLAGATFGFIEDGLTLDESDYVTGPARYGVEAELEDGRVVVSSYP